MGSELMGPGEDPPPPLGTLPLSEGTISLSPVEVNQLRSGFWYAQAVARIPPRRPGQPSGFLPVRGRILLLDSDGDGVADFLDQCPATPPGTLVNSSGCSLDQVCPCAGPWKNHGEFVTTLKQALEEFVQEGLLNRGASRLLFQSGAESDCGKRVTPDLEPTKALP